MAGLHDQARFTGADRVDDVRHDAGPVHSMLRTALGGLSCTMTAIDAATKG